MPMVLNEKWISDRLNDISSHNEIDQTLNRTISAAWLITQLSKYNIPFKVYNLGAGVRRITTKTNYCPCCKKNL